MKAIIFLAIVTVISPQVSADTCHDCGELIALKAKFVKAKSQAPDDRLKVVEKMIKAIGRIDLVDGEFDESQANLIVSIFKTVTDEGYRQALIEYNISRFSDSRNRLASILKEGGESQQILRDIDSLLAVQRYGQSPPKDVMPPMPASGK